ncbi:hypothetical protein KL86CLO1_11847 [uncultured Eubacteriales bacterium]|uniref:Uncharacterized protein n=1 Tax=uncultured Eubacteriales bacterium TaxID=172733 RepID=A0A212JWX3_9FIRM|nr:hypothetical protein KL86CLO1_11847 [uncultured Eubacteriales bacterium]
MDYQCNQKKKIINAKHNKTPVTIVVTGVYLEKADTLMPGGAIAPERTINLPYHKNDHTFWCGHFYGTAEGIRTPDLLVRSQTLYPTELQPHTALRGEPLVDSLFMIAQPTLKCKNNFQKSA